MEDILKAIDRAEEGLRDAVEEIAAIKKMVVGVVGRLSVDETDAPEGFRAVPSTKLCQGCYFYERFGGRKVGSCPTSPCCIAGERRDKTRVIFVKK